MSGNSGNTATGWRHLARDPRPRTLFLAADQTMDAFVFTQFFMHGTSVKLLPNNWAMLFTHVSNPKPGHTTGRSGRGGARREGGAGRGWAGWDADGSVCPGDNRPSYLPDDRKKLSSACLWKREQRKLYVNRWRNKTSGWPAVYSLFVRGTTAALRSWLLINVLTPNCLCGPFLYKACPGTLRKHEQKETYVTAGRTKRSVDPRFIRGLSVGRRPLFVPGCWPVYRRLFGPVKLFHTRRVREHIYIYIYIYIYTQ